MVYIWVKLGRGGRGEQGTQGEFEFYGRGLQHLYGPLSSAQSIGTLVRESEEGGACVPGHR
jgi:hypothetical protein